MKTTAHLHEIYDFYEMPFIETIWFKLVIAAGIIIILSCITFLILRKKKRRKPSWEIALSKLTALPIEKYTTKQDFKKIYFEITTILKYYLTERYGWKILDKTDDELINYLDKNKFDESLLAIIKKLFMGASVIKYADESALKTQVEEDIKMIKQFITKTIPTE